MKKIKLFDNFSLSDEEELNQYLNDLLDEYKSEGVFYKIDFLKDQLNLKIYSEILYNTNENEWYCFNLNNCIDSIKHLISYIYSLEYQLEKSFYYELSFHRSEPYGFIMNPFMKDLNSILKFIDGLEDICKLDLNFFKN